MKSINSGSHFAPQIPVNQQVGTTGNETVGAGGLRPALGKDQTPQRPHSPAGKVSTFDGRGRVFTPGGGSYTPPTRSRSNSVDSEFIDANSSKNTNDETSNNQDSQEKTKEKKWATVTTNYGGGVTRSQIGRDGGKVPQSDISVQEQLYVKVEKSNDKE